MRGLLGQDKQIHYQKHYTKPHPDPANGDPKEILNRRITDADFRASDVGYAPFKHEDVRESETES
jgi:hypothetical protein